MVPFHMLDMISCYIVPTMRSFSLLYDFKNAVTLKIGLGILQGH